MKTFQILALFCVIASSMAFSPVSMPEGEFFSVDVDKSCRFSKKPFEVT